jgi:Lar family restriction alleviation protein
MMAAKLEVEAKACPFCGGTILTLYEYHDQEEVDAYIQCNTCTSIGPSGNSKSKAITAWEHRVS